jgi:hypothetical protein
VCANIPQIPSTFLLEKASAITKRLIPSLGGEVDTFYRIIPEIQGGWFYLTPRFISNKNLISEFSDSEFSILVYGEIFQQKYNSNAKYIREIYDSGNIDSIRQLDGCFSAVIIDMNRSTICMVCDMVGHRSLRYYCNGQSFFTSSHDIPIVATGLCSIDFNLESAYSILSFGWSLQGESLIKDVKTVHPNEYITWDRETNVKSVYKPLLNLKERFSSNDIASQNAQIDLMIEEMLSYVRVVCDREPVIEADLTAGIDSRAIIGIILAVIDSSRLKIYSDGEDDNLDVKIARRVAESYGFEHNHSTPDTPKIETFLNYAKLLAFFMNGDTDSRRAVDSLPQIDRYHPPHFKGLGGEIYRGHYYHFKSNRTLNKLTSDDAVQILFRKFHRVDDLPILSIELRESVKKKLQNIIYCYNNISTHGADLLDLFYLYERFGRWGALDARGRWFQRYISPFGNPALVKLAFKLPPPIGNSYLLHKTIIARFLPELYYWPINNKDLLTFLGPSIVKTSGKFICNGTNYVYRKILKTPFYIGKDRKNYLSQDNIRSDYFSDVLGSNLYDIFLKNDSFSNNLFGKFHTERMINAHISRTSNYMQLIGSLITMEQWSDLVHQAYQLAKE